MDKQKYIKVKADIHKAAKTKAAEAGIAMEDYIDKILRTEFKLPAAKVEKKAAVNLEEEKK